jgi:predicted O-linked N-acetylglucosamine transferase (SPINDLY family)
LFEANAHRNAGHWLEAIESYGRLCSLAPLSPELRHNLALCFFAYGQYQEALDQSSVALDLKSDLWQSRIIRGKAYRGLNFIALAQADFEKVLSFDPANAEARLALADMALNEFGAPGAAIQWVKPLQDNPGYAKDAKLTYLMASLYERPDWQAPHSAEQLSDEIKAFSSSYLRLPEVTLPAFSKRHGHYRPRVALISPQFFMSPVYFLTISAWRKIAKDCDLVIFNRGNRHDGATQEFRTLANEWHEVQLLLPEALARKIYAADIDILYDLGGWMDPVALKALSTKPARKQFKWVGGQSVTTGLDSFDGWIGDDWQSPQHLQNLYSEPLVQVPGGYATYTAPDYLPAPATNKSTTPCIFSNPAKVSQPFLDRLSKREGKLIFIHRQYRHSQVQERILAGLEKKLSDVEFITPSGHEDALKAVNCHATMIDTFPYSSGLTAREALAMNTKIEVLEIGSLFCERHTAYVA